MRKIITLLITTSLISSLQAEDDYEDFNPIEYSFQESDDPSYTGTNFGSYYRRYPSQEDDYAGSCYYSCSRAACLTVGVALGAVMVIAIVAAITSDGNSAHCH